MKLFDESLFDAEFIKYIQKLSAHLKLPPALVVQNIVLAKLARDKAEIDVYGMSDGLLLDFPSRTDEDGSLLLITGAELYNMTYESERKRYESEYIEQIKHKLSTLDGGYCEAGIRFHELPGEQQKLLEQHGADPLARLEKAKAEHDIKQAQKNGDIGEVEINWNKKE